MTVVYDSYNYEQGFSGLVRHIARTLINQKPTKVPHWQAQDVSGTPLETTYEITNCVLTYPVPYAIDKLQMEVVPNLPWAEDHFQERVSGEPHNPPPSAAWWPFARAQHEDHVDERKKFSHTYPERMWPKKAGGFSDYNDGCGIRYELGDVKDLLRLLAQNPHTRQAYLPIWFPEDLDAAANHGQRVPCTLGYHFLLRSDLLHITYPIRSCDFVRHFRDDVYMAARLVQWVVEMLKFDNFELDSNPDVWEKVMPGTLTMHAVSMHCFEGDVNKLRREYGAS